MRIRGAADLPVCVCQRLIIRGISEKEILLTKGAKRHIFESICQFPPIKNERCIKSEVNTKKEQVKIEGGLDFGKFPKIYFMKKEL